MDKSQINMQQTGQLKSAPASSAEQQLTLIWQPYDSNILSIENYAIQGTH